MKAEGVICSCDGHVQSLSYPAATMLVLAGAPGAGKTTLAKRLISASSAPRLEIDVIAAEEVAGRPRGFSDAAGFLLERAARVMAQEQRLVVDSTAVNPAYRLELIRLARRHGLEPHLLGFDATAAECAAGIAARPPAPFPPMPPDVFDYYQSAWQALKASVLSGRLLLDEDWRSVTVLDRASAAALGAIHFG